MNSSQWNNPLNLSQKKAAAYSNAAFMSRVYLWMTFGLLLTGGVAYQIAATPYIMQNILSHSYIMIGLIILQLGTVIALSAAIDRMSSLLATSVYIFYTALTGVTFSVLFLVYTSQSISQVFFLTSFAFAGLSAIGYLTKRDLGPIGSFCTIGLFGLIGFVFLALIFPSILTNAVSMTISTLGIMIFAGLTAYDTQRIKSLNDATASFEEIKKRSIHGALMLYLDFINLFLNMLRLFGDRR
ncbi:MAG: Bax inhibitor-1/YccA family protein [Gammaproteobacteria bacterium]|nr:Bax inhibitor-1/YccA family protein [Gammaproteobacteria bacterium]